MNKVYIVDGNSLLFRAYYATAAMSNGDLMKSHDGTPTNGVYAFSNMINTILKSLKEGDSLFVGFDTGHQTFRHKEDENYKANRKPCPEELKVQINNLYPSINTIIEPVNMSMNSAKSLSFT